MRVLSFISYTAALADSSDFSKYITHSCPQLLRVKLGQPFPLLPSYRLARQWKRVKVDILTGLEG